MTHSETEIVVQSLAESKRLIKENDSRIAEAIVSGGFVRQQHYFHHPVLFKLLHDLGANSDLLQSENELIAVPLVQFLVIDNILRTETDVKTLKKLRKFIGASTQVRDFFQTWHDRGRFIVFMESTGLTTWTKLAKTLTDDLAGVHLMEGSLPFCKVSPDVLFNFIRNDAVVNNHPGGLYYLSEYLTQKFQLDEVFKNELTAQLPQIIADDTLRQLLPGILKGIINGDPNVFEQWLNQLLKDYGKHHPSDLMIAFAAACPDLTASKLLLKQTLQKQKAKALLPAANYIRAINVAKFKDDPEIWAELESRSTTSNDVEELRQIINYLIDQLDKSGEAWYKSIAANIAINPDDQLSGWIAHFFEMLTEYDHHLVYTLQTKRFQQIGDTSFIKRHWYMLIQKDKTAFQTNLTHWFNHRDRKVHRAMLRLSSVREIEDSDLILSQEALAKLTPGDKLFIGIKIAGYVYGKDPLQSLMFSLIESLLPEDTDVMTELFNIMFNYVVYNYRSILETVKTMISGGKLPAHLQNFYQSLDQHYEDYFESLRQVKDFSELRPDSKLSQHIQFYTQRKFSDEFAAAPRPAWLDFGKTTPLPSHRWAIRRKNEDVHQVSPLGHIETSAEFPSGERLNPIFQETMRRTYQN